jgi:hypothetical protein
MKVAVYHPFQQMPDYYSLSHDIKEQLLMLVEHGVEAHLVVSHYFKAQDEIPQDVIIHAVLHGDGPQIYQIAEPILKDMNVVITHDVVYLHTYERHDQALRLIADQHPNIRWIHTIHSAPNLNDKKKPFPNSLYISQNRTDVPLVAQQYQVPEAYVRVVYIPVSADQFFDWHPFTKQLVEKHDLLNCDVLIVFPLDTGRFQAKGGYKIIKLVEKMRAEKKNAKVVFINAAAKKEERDLLVKGLQNEYTIFTSLENPQYVEEVPNRVVRELMQIANVFPFLSISETCGRVMVEAALTKNLVILNEDWPPMREFGEVDHVLYMKTSSTRCQTTYNPSEDHYYTEWAKTIINQVDSNKPLKFQRKVLRCFDRDWIWKNQLEPLLHETRTGG